MSKRIMVMILIGLVLNVFFMNSTILASSKEEKLISKIKIGVNQLGTGKESKVKVKLKDNTQINGYISRITETDFSVIQEKTNSEKLVSFPQVKQVKGNNLSKGAKIAIGVGILVSIIAVLAYFSLGENER